MLARYHARKHVAVLTVALLFLATAGRCPAATLQYDYDAAIDTNGNALWENALGSPSNREWTFDKSSTPVAVTSAGTAITRAYHFNTGGATDPNYGATGSFNGSAIDGAANGAAAFEVWFKPDDLDAGDKEVLFETGGNVRGASLTLNGSTLQFRTRNSANTNANFTLTPAMVDDFVQVVGVVDGAAGQTRIYVNGQARGVVGGTRDWSLGTSPAGLGLRNQSDTQLGGFDDAEAADYGGYEGQIARVRLYDGEQDAGEVYASYAQLTPNTNPYANAVLADSPIGYWRLGEATGATAVNQGQLGVSIDGTHMASGPTLGDPGLITSDPNTATRFNGVLGGGIDVPNNSELNGATSNRTVDLWFKVHEINPNWIRALFENGGQENGMNVYLYGDGNTIKLRTGVFGKPGDTQYSLFPAGVAVDADQTHYATSVFRNGKLTLYLDGAPVSSGSSGNLTTIPQQANNNGIGNKRHDTRYHNGATSGDGTSLNGVIDEVAVYDGSLSLRQIQTHYAAGSGDRLGITPGATLGVLLNYDAGLDTDGDAVWEDTIGSRDNATAASQFDWSLGAGVTRLAVNGTKFRNVSHAYEFHGSDGTTLAKTYDSLVGDPSKSVSASFEILFDPDNFTGGDQVLFRTGGKNWGTSFTLVDNLLKFDVVNDMGSRKAETSFDLAMLEQDEQDDFIHAIGVVDLDGDQTLLYVNNVFRDEAFASLSDWSGTDTAALGHLGGSAPIIDERMPDPFNGKIALFRLYEGTLTAADVRANFIALVPEPGSLVLLAMGIAMLLPPVRRRRSCLTAAP